MGFTIMKPIEYLHGFLNRLVVLDKSFNKIDAQCESDRQKIIDDQVAAMSQVEQKHTHVRAASTAKAKALKKYESSLRMQVQLEEQRNNEIYEIMTKSKLAGNTLEVERLRLELFANKEQVKQNRDSVWREYQDECDKIIITFDSKQQDKNRKLSNTQLAQSRELEEFETSSLNGLQLKLKAEADSFNSKFNPATVEKDYAKTFAAEPYADSYKCKKSNPESVRIASLSFDLSPLNLGERAVSFLESNYPVLFRNNKINIPFSLTFDNSFNYLFEVGLGDKKGRETLVNRACALAMRLFMMIPPNKINLTFIDPITLGETFALFTRLVDVDDRTTKVINGKIWTSTADIDDRLRVLTDHIANVTQRCLQGQYNSIQKYNERAGQNAEPYEVLMIMDFPGGFKEDSFRMLEQIISTGPKCGVYTVILKSGEQIAKMDDKLKPLVDNIEAKTTRFYVNGDDIALDKKAFSFHDRGALLIMDSLLPPGKLNAVISTLKDGIKNAEKLVITLEEMLTLTKLVNKNEWFKGDSSSELVVPIGIHGVDNIQNLSFGLKYGAYHALIAGQIGSGKSSLLHTIIMSSLLKYSTDQLQVFLVDFKRGVEFKIYANYILNSFRVVAIESEREFGNSVLDFLDKEQSRRADKFKRVDVDNVHDYRQKTGEVLPRILIIIDEFHVLFTKDNDMMSKNASAHLEQIIRQGRAFGIHVILASQTMMNVGGIHQGVWGQVGVRIALKCPKADARFILGSDNDAVDLLSPNDPGQAVYNSDCGNVIANTIFRVAYIEQKSDAGWDQEGLLKEISARSQKLERVRKLELPETRVMLSNVEDNIYNRFQKFARGKDVEFNENAVFIGESLQLFNVLRTTFRGNKASNMLVIGGDEQKARTMFTFCALSLTLHKLTVNQNKKPSRPDIYVVDYAPIEDPFDKDMLIELVEMLPDFIKYVDFEESDMILKELFDDLNRRQKAPSKDSRYLLLFGLQRARDLRSNDPYMNNKQEDNYDEFGSDIHQKLSVTPYEMFLRLLQNGAAHNIHSIIWEDSFKTFMAHYSNMLASFDLRVGFTMPDEDSVLYIEEPNASLMSENNAVFSYNGNQRFRPYKKPDLVWLKKVCERINSYK